VTCALLNNTADDINALSEVVDVRPPLVEQVESSQQIIRVPINQHLEENGNTHTGYESTGVEMNSPSEVVEACALRPLSTKYYYY